MDNRKEIYQSFPPNIDNLLHQLLRELLVSSGVNITHLDLLLDDHIPEISLSLVEWPLSSYKLGAPFKHVLQFNIFLSIDFSTVAEKNTETVLEPFLKGSG